MKASVDRVKLTPPLPWITAAGDAGFVTELTGSQLTLKAHDGKTLPSGEFTIHVALNPQISFEFHGTSQLTDQANTLCFQTVGDQGRERLRDLLGQIRKGQHIEICRDEDVEASDRFTGFQRVHFVPEALPDMNLEHLNTKVDFLGRNFDYPILITGMTGGIDQGTVINRRLAAAAARFNIPMGIGSQRIALDNPSYAEIFAVKRWQPDLFLIGNLGFAQLLQDDYLSLCERAIDMIQADALAIHLNVLQEAVQVEGDRKFQGILDRIHKVSQQVSVPILLKEVGSGMSPNTAQRLKDAGVAAIDVGGRGGTSWGYIEGLRSSFEETQRLGETFRNWGIPTAYSLAAIRSQFKDLPLVATGGIRDGLTVAKAVALGATMAGVGLPLLRAALDKEEGPSDALSTLVRGLRTTMLATGSQSLDKLEHHICLGLPLETEFDKWIHSKSFY